MTERPDRPPELQAPQQQRAPVSGPPGPGGREESSPEAKLRRKSKRRSRTQHRAPTGDSTAADPCASGSRPPPVRAPASGYTTPGGRVYRPGEFIPASDRVTEPTRPEPKPPFVRTTLTERVLALLTPDGQMVLRTLRDTLNTERSYEPLKIREFRALIAELEQAGTVSVGGSLHLLNLVSLPERRRQILTELERRALDLLGRSAGMPCSELQASLTGNRSGPFVRANVRDACNALIRSGQATLIGMHSSDGMLRGILCRTDRQAEMTGPLDTLILDAVRQGVTSTSALRLHLDLDPSVLRWMLGDLLRRGLLESPTSRRSRKLRTYTPAS